MGQILTQVGAFILPQALSPTPVPFEEAATGLPLQALLYTMTLMAIVIVMVMTLIAVVR
jgi:hypothetical protein